MTSDRKEYLYNYHKERFHRVPLNLEKQKYEEIKAAASAVGESVNGYIKRAIDERMSKAHQIVEP